jgi:uncharacterized protein YndB with AHSA1/START domain
VRVDCPVEDAFRLFTERFAEWWPLAQCSEECILEPWPGGKVLERSRSGEERESGSVTIFDPPRRLQLTWNAGAPADPDQTVDVEFCVEADGTRITLTHSGWHLAGVETCACIAQSFSLFVAEQMLVAI